MAIKIIRPDDWHFPVIIEWPEGYTTPMAGHSITIYEGDSGDMITTISAMNIHCDANGSIWAELEMFADEEGKPILTGEPVSRNNEIILGVFNAYVVQMLSKLSAKVSYNNGLKGKPKPSGPIRRQK
jgi:hypothetical protein